MTRRVLGRGLSALLSDRPSVMSSEEMVEIDTDLIEPNNFQPRTNFNEEKLEELAQSIRANGVIQPLLVRRVDNDKYQLVAGERRWRAAQRAGLLKVPCVVREIPEDKMLELALVENIQRQELSAIEEAQAYKRLIETLGFTQEMVAQRVGRDRTFITNYLRLLRLPEDIQQMVEVEKLSTGHARALLGIDDPEIQRKLAKNIIDKGLSVRQIEYVVKSTIEGKSQPGDESSVGIKEDANVKAAEAKLRRKLSSKVNVVLNHKNGGGRIEITFYDEKDLGRIYDLIMGKDEQQ